MQPLDFLQTAECLLLTGQREPDWRTTVSRSYYALYWMISQELLSTIPLLLLQSASLCRKDHVLHEKLPQALISSSDPRIREFGALLENLRIDRIKSDYKLSLFVSKAKAADVYENAIDLRSEVQKYGIGKLVKTVRFDLEKVHADKPPRSE